LPSTPDEVKKKVHEGIRDIIVSLEAVSRSFLYSMQSPSTLLDVTDKYQIPDMFDHQHLDEETSGRGFATQFCGGVNYWSRVHINNNFYYTTLSCLSEDMNYNSILFYFVFPSYIFAVPMRSGDVVCFNPLIYH
jgi:hypothetical protein